MVTLLWQSSLQAVYRQHEQEKRQYDQCVREVEHATFTPLVLSSTGGMGKAATVFYQRLASMLSEKRGIQYSKTIGWLRCRMSFALLRCSIMCIRGARSSQHHPATEAIDLQLAEGQLHWETNVNIYLLLIIIIYNRIHIITIIISYVTGSAYVCLLFNITYNSIFKEKTNKKTLLWQVL